MAIDVCVPIAFGEVLQTLLEPEPKQFCVVPRPSNVVILSLIKNALLHITSPFKSKPTTIVPMLHFCVLMVPGGPSGPVAPVAPGAESTYAFVAASCGSVGS